MSIFKGKENYDSDKEFVDRTKKRLNAKSRGKLGNARHGFMHDGGDFSEMPNTDLYVNWMKEQIGKNDNLNILEVGCGFGRWAPALDGYYRSYTGVDITEDRIKYAKSEYSRKDRTFVHVGKNWHFGRQFDIVFCCYVLQHLLVPDTVDLLKCMRDSLKPNGKILAWEQKIGDFSLEDAEWAYLNDGGVTIIPKPIWLMEENVPELKWKLLTEHGKKWPKEYPKGKKLGYELNGFEITF